MYVYYLFVRLLDLPNGLLQLQYKYRYKIYMATEEC